MRWVREDYDRWISRGCPVDTNVITLVMVGVGLESLTENIDNLPNLTLLKVSMNNIKKLPTSLTRLRRLAHLYADSNMLEDVSDLPDTIECLDLSVNFLHTFPDFIFNMPRLNSLRIHHNNNFIFYEPERLLTIGRDFTIFMDEPIDCEFFKTRTENIDRQFALCGIVKILDTKSKILPIELGNGKCLVVCLQQPRVISDTKPCKKS